MLGPYFSGISKLLPFSVPEKRLSLREATGAKGNSGQVSYTCHLTEKGNLGLTYDCEEVG